MSHSELAIMIHGTMTLGDPPNPTSFTLFITVKSSKKFASVFWRAHYRVKKFLQWLPPTMGPSAPIKGFAFGPSSTHLRVHLGKALHTRRRDHSLHGVANLGCWRVKVKSLERGLSEKGPMLWTTSPGFWKHPLCRYPTFLCLIFGWIFSQ